MRLRCRTQSGSTRTTSRSTFYTGFIRSHDMGHVATACPHPQRAAQRAQHTVAAGSEYDNPALYSNEDAVGAHVVAT